MDFFSLYAGRSHDDYDENDWSGVTESPEPWWWGLLVIPAALLLIYVVVPLCLLGLLLAGAWYLLTPVHPLIKKVFGSTKSLVLLFLGVDLLIAAALLYLFSTTHRVPFIH